MFRKITDFYSHLFNEEGDIVVAYFVTKTGTEYRVYFYPARDYSDLIENYFNLVNKESIIFKNGFIFGFTKVGVNEDKKEQPDMKIRNTIINIINEFFESEGANNILIYHCDNSDNKNAKRFIYFDEWFKTAAIKSHYKKYDEVIVVMGLDEHDKLINSFDSEMIISKQYISLIIQSDNSKIDIILEEFRELKEQLITEK